MGIMHRKFDVKNFTRRKLELKNLEEGVVF
jgi:hypothetical protein